MTKWLLGTIAVVALVGVADGAYLTALKVQDEVQGRADSAVCDAVSETGCAIALESPMSTIGPLPVSLLALATYILIIGLVIVVWLGGASPGSKWGSFASGALKLIAAGAAIYSVVLAGYSYSQDSWCPFCIGMYVINAIMLGCTLALDGSYVQAIKGVFAPAWPPLAAFVSFAVLLGGGYAAFAWSVDHFAGDEIESGYARADKAIKAGRYPMPIDGAASAGPADAALTIVKFSDFQCPYCKRMWLQIEELRDRNPGKIRVVFRHNPLSNACNPMMAGTFHKRACQAAWAAHCAHVQGKFWEMGDRLFKSQPKFSDEQLRGYAEEVGLDLAAYDACLTDPKTIDAVRRDTLLARSIGAGGTPSSIINGFLFPGALTAVTIEAIASYIEKLGATQAAAPNERLQRQSAVLAAGKKAVSVSPRSFVTGDGARVEVVAYADPDDRGSRAQLAHLFKLQRVHRKLIRVSVRILGDGADQRLLACGFQAGHGGFVAKMVGQSKGGSDGLAETLSKDKEALGQCLDSDGGAAILKEDAAAAAAAGIASPTAFVDGYEIGAEAGAEELDQLIAAVLLTVSG